MLEIAGKVGEAPVYDIYACCGLPPAYVHLTRPARTLSPKRDYTTDLLSLSVWSAVSAAVLKCTHEKNCSAFVVCGVCLWLCPRS